MRNMQVLRQQPVYSKKCLQLQDTDAYFIVKVIIQSTLKSIRILIQTPLFKGTGIKGKQGYV